MPIALPLGYRPNIVILNCDDPPLSLYTPEALPWFMANQAAGSLWYPNASANGPLCLPGRISVLTGQRMEHHRGYDNGSGANLRLGETLFAPMQRAGYRTAAIGKGINGWGETNAGGFGAAGMLFPGTDYQRLQFGAPNYFDYEICDELGQLTAYGAAPADYAVDVELGFITEFVNATPASQPLFMYWASKAPHQDAGGFPIPAPRHASLSISVPHSPSFGLDPAAYGNPPWMVKAATSPWDAAAINDITSRHLESLRTLRSLDEALQALFALLTSTGRLASTVIFIMGDNAHAFGEMRLDDKGTCHRSSSSKLLRIIAPGVAGGTRYQAVSDIDIAPTCCHLGGARLPVAPDGMSLWRTVTNSAEPFRQAAPIGSLVKDSPTQAGLWYGPEAGRPNGGRVYYEGLPGGKAEGEVGCWTDYDMTTDQGPQPDAALTLALLRGGVYANAPGAVALVFDVGATSARIEWVHSALPSGGSTFLLMGASDAANGMRVELNVSGAIKLLGLVAGTATLIAQYTGVSPVVGDVLAVELEVSGGVYVATRAYKSGAQLTVNGATTPPSGVVWGNHCGISAASKRGAFASFRAQSLTAGGQPPVLVTPPSITDNTPGTPPTVGDTATAAQGVWSGTVLQRQTRWVIGSVDQAVAGLAYLFDAGDVGATVTYQERVEGPGVGVWTAWTAAQASIGPVEALPAGNQPPSLSLSGPASAVPGATLPYTATASDSDGSIVSYAWTQTAGPAGVIASGQGTAAVQFTLPTPTVTTPITLSCTVTDDDGATTTRSFTTQVVVAVAGGASFGVGINASTGTWLQETQRMVFADALYTCGGPEGVLYNKVQAPLDADGWPTGDFGLPVLDLNGYEPFPAGLHGTWTFDYEATQKISIESRFSRSHLQISSHTFTAGTGLKPGDGKGRVVFTPQADDTALFITCFNTGGGCRRMHLWRPGAATDGSQVFMPGIADMFGAYAYIRPLDPVGGNLMQSKSFAGGDGWPPYNTVANRHFGGRNDVAAMTQDPWLPNELTIQLSGALGIGGWAFMPVRYTGVSVTQWAEHLGDAVAAVPTLTWCAFEVANEVWNPGIGVSFAWNKTETFAEIGYVAGQGTSYTGQTINAPRVVSVVANGATADITFNRPHGRTTGDPIRVMLASPASARQHGGVACTVISPTVLRYPLAANYTGPVTLDTSGVVEGFVAGDVLSATGDGSTVVITFRAPHGLASGVQRKISGLSQVGYANFMGPMVTPTGPTTATYPCDATAPNAIVTGAYVLGFSPGSLQSVTGDGTTATLTWKTAHGLTGPSRRDVVGVSLPAFNSPLVGGVQQPVTLTVVDATRVSYPSTARGTAYPSTSGWVALRGDSELLETDESNVTYVQMFRHFRQAWEAGNAAKIAFAARGIAHKCRPILSWQVAQATQMEKGLQWLRATGREPSAVFWGYTVAGYVTGNNDKIPGGGYPDARPIADTPQEVADALRICVDNLGMRYATEETSSQAMLNNMRPVVYESGVDTDLFADQVAAAAAHELPDKTYVITQAYHQQYKMGAVLAGQYTGGISKSWEGKGCFGLATTLEGSLHTSPPAEWSPTFQGVMHAIEDPLPSYDRHVVQSGQDTTIDGRDFIGNRFWQATDAFPTIGGASHGFLAGKRTIYYTAVPQACTATLSVTLELTTTAAATLGVRVGDTAMNGMTDQATAAVPQRTGQHVLTMPVTLAQGVAYLALGNDTSTAQNARMRVLSLTLTGVTPA